jgi:hypothetical protein
MASTVDAHPIGPDRTAAPTKQARMKRGMIATLYIRDATLTRPRQRGKSGI